MSLNVTAFETHLEIQINARSPKEFQHDLAEIAGAFPRYDRTFDPDRQVWVIPHFEKYAGIPMVANAIESRRRQMELFK